MMVFWMQNVNFLTKFTNKNLAIPDRFPIDSFFAINYANPVKSILWDQTVMVLFLRHILPSIKYQRT